jgi:hypothetical protein
MMGESEDVSIVTYPPEMLPAAGGSAQVIVVDPATGEETIVYDTEQQVH